MVHSRWQQTEVHAQWCQQESVCVHVTEKMNDQQLNCWVTTTSMESAKCQELHSVTYHILQCRLHAPVECRVAMNLDENWTAACELDPVHTDTTLHSHSVLDKQQVQSLWHISHYVTTNECVQLKLFKVQQWWWKANVSPWYQSLPL